MDCFAADDGSPYSPLTSLLRELFEPFDKELVWQSEMTVPGTSQQLIDGELDGSCGRLKVSNHQEIWPDMVFLDVPVAAVHTAIWVRRDTERLDPRSDKIGYLKSMEVFQDQASAMGFANAVAFDQPGALFESLRQGELDGIFGDEGLLGFDQHVAGMRHEGLYVYERISKLQAYPMIHKRFAHLKSALEARLSILTRRFMDNTVALQMPGQLPAPGAETIVFGCPRYPGSLISNAFEALHSQAFARLGMAFKMESLPFLRVEQGLADGRFGGSCGRPVSLDSALGVPLVPVDYLLARISIQLWGARQQLRQESLFELPEGSRVAAVRGISLGPVDLRRYFQDRGVNLIERGDVRQVVEMISKGEVDYVLGYQTPFMDAMNTVKVKRDLYLIASGPKEKIIPFLSEQYAHLRDDYAQALLGVGVNFDQVVLELSNRSLVYYYPDYE
ncbi:MAG: hypothetical protein AseanaTS_29960 [Candidatus Pelagadaptatus aseana]